MINVKQALERGFADAPFIAHLGIQLNDLGDGWCEASLELQDWHLQQTGVAHAGVVATLADHTSGAAAFTQVDEGEFVVSVEYKINLLKGAKGDRLRCRAEVLKRGQTLSVVEARVYAEGAGRKDLVASFNATMAVLKFAAERRSPPRQ
jgi:uncharacterized protein (TIGR00369 family)